MVNVQIRKDYGIKFHTTISKVLEYIIGFIFVDDTDLSKCNFKSSIDTIDNVAERMQRSIDQWERTLKATGGTLWPDKCFVYAISFKFKPSEAYEYEKVDDLDI